MLQSRHKHQNADIESAPFRSQFGDTFNDIMR